MNEKLNREGLLIAIKRNEIDEFLSGSGMYRLGYNPYAPGNTMLNLSPAMSAIYSYYIDEPEKRVDLKLENTLLDWLTWKSGIGVYAVFSVLSYQLRMELSNKSSFKINKDKINKELKKALDIYKDDLKVLKEYEGESLKEGLWEAMQIENKINIKNYGIKIL
ncbi:hypothetical protein [uncultured Clostridium sp.]|uniref:hypothetical protein n=1 Tax=uncultured Clostridium sp. TaxID=59620 RepID=UPI0028E6526A|nr:hypothetical protein [uncultured Clostridium sp.]